MSFLTWTTSSGLFHRACCPSVPSRWAAPGRVSWCRSGMEISDVVPDWLLCFIWWQSVLLFDGLVDLFHEASAVT